MIALFAMLAAQLVDLSPWAGFYRSSTREVGAALELEADGSFAYALDYGAVSETAEGRWRLDGEAIRLAPTKVEGAWKGGDLVATPLRRADNALLLDRYGVTVRFEREGEPAIPVIPNKKLERAN